MEEEYENISVDLSEDTDNDVFSEEERDQEFDQQEYTQTRSIYDDESVNKVNINKRKDNNNRTFVVCDQEINNFDIGKITIVKFDTEKIALEHYNKITNTSDITIEFVNNFQRKDCFICNWRTLLIREETSVEGLISITVKGYPTIDPNKYNIFMKMTDISKNITLATDAYNYYVSKIQISSNNNLNSGSEENRNNTMKFPDITAMHIFLHYTKCGDSTEKKLEKLSDIYYEACMYIYNNMGLIKKNNESGEIFPDSSNLAYFVKCTDQMVKIKNSVDVKNNPTTNKVTNKIKLNKN